MRKFLYNFIYKVLVLAREDFEPGFNLTGVKTVKVNNPEEAEEKLHEQLNLKENNIILIDEGLTGNLQAKLKEKIFLSEQPIIMMLPLGKELKEKTAEDEFSSFISTTIGYKIRIK